ncbi:hypothetical protein T492DRAFT_1058148 [Pavlovales sp. CCMP2436]|nr:hypothetical protein T492DRAFT_1058148 [Pavlovales sp. CCMP2436]
MCPRGTLAMKAIPLSQLQDSIRLEVKWASQTEWGTYSTAAASTSGCTVSNIKLHISGVRMDGAVERAMMDMLGGVVTMSTFDYSHTVSACTPASVLPVRSRMALETWRVFLPNSITRRSVSAGFSIAAMRRPALQGHRRPHAQQILAFSACRFLFECELGLQHLIILRESSVSATSCIWGSGGSAGSGSRGSGAIGACVGTYAGWSA